jgi:putative PEP-CTERM system TPR-repeat lipoprotein
MTHFFMRSLSILILSCALFACSEDITSEDHFKSAKELLTQSDSKSAINELKNAVIKDVNNAQARALLGRVYFDSGAYENAEKELSRAFSSGVDPTIIVPVLAEVLLGLGDYEKLGKLTLDGLDPYNRSTVLAAKGLALIYQGDLLAASEIMETALRNEPTSTYAQVAAARLSMANGAYGEVRTRLASILETEPTYAPAWNLLGDIESAEGQTAEAEKAYSQVIKNSKYSFDAMLNRAMMRIYQRKWAAAKDDLKSLDTKYRQAKYHPGVYFAWGIVQLHQMNFLQAEKYFVQASEFSDAYPLTFYYLTAINLENGLIQQAYDKIYRFLALVPTSVAGAKLAARLELEQKGYEKAEELLLPIVAAQPDDLEALNLLATALLAQGKSGEGVEMLARVAELQPDSAEAKTRLGAGFFAEGSDELGIEILKDILVTDPGYEQADILIVLNLLRRNDVEGALSAAAGYRDRNPASATSYNLLGRSYVANEEPDRAKAAFNKALLLRPGDPGASHSLAKFELEAKRYKLARRHYEVVLQHNSDHMPTLLKIAASYAVEGNEQEMLNSIQSILASHPRAMEPRLIKARYFIAMGQLDKAEPIFDELTDEQKESPNALVTIAGFELAVARYNQAIVTLDKLTDYRPNVGQYHYMKSKAHAGLGDIEKLTAELKRAVELNPKHFYAKIALARLALLSHNMEAFDQRLAELKVISPENPDVLKLEVVSAQERGDNKHALKLLQKVLERAPTTDNAIAVAVHLESVGDVDGAIVQLQKWVADHTGDIFVREKLAELYGSVNRVGGVIYQYRAILKIEPTHVVALNNIAWYLQEDDPVQALALAKQAFALAPDSALILDTLAMTQMRTNNLAEARRYINRALALEGDSPEMRFHETQIRASEGDREEAVKSLTALLNENKQFSERARAEAFLKKLKQ